jgi:hypothetical protein
VVAVDHQQVELLALAVEVQDKVVWEQTQQTEQ